MAKRIFQHTVKLTEPRNKDVLYIAKCAVTGERIVTPAWEQSPAVQDEAIWFKCPACGGVHVSLLRRDEDRLGQD